MRKPNPRDPDYAITKPLWLEYVRIRRPAEVVETVRHVETVKHVEGPERVVYVDRIIEPDTSNLEAAVERLRKAKAKIEDTAAPKAKAEEPPAPEVNEILAEHDLTVHDTYERINEILLPKHVQAKSSAEMARNYGGTFDGKSVIEWEKKADRLGAPIKWNRGRSAETI